MNNMQFWQQQLMCKQLQDPQRQQQLQQLDEGARHPSPHNQLSAVAKPATGNQPPATLNEMPVNDAYNYVWPNDFVGGMHNLPNNSLIFTAGNTNWVQSNISPAMHNLVNGVVLSDCQSDTMRSVGFMSHQIDQTYHGIPVSGTSTVNQYSHLGISNNCHDLVTEADATHAKASYTSRTFQTDQRSAAQVCLQDKTLATTHNFKGKHFFGNSPVQDLGNDVTSGSFQSTNNLQHSVHFQEFHGRQEQDSSVNLQGKQISQVGTSSGVASLDPIEQKLLFGTDDDNCGFSFGGSLISSMGVDMHGHSSENDHVVAFPSIQSGSWSALMQDAVQASSSNNRLQEEWTGLNSQKSEQLMVKPPIMTNDNGKRPSAWDDRNLQSASSLTSTTVPLFNDADSILGSFTSPSDQHCFKSAHEENNGVSTEAPHASFLSTAKGAHNSEFYHSCDQSQLSEGGLHAQRPSTSGVWSGQRIKRHDKNPGDIRLKSQNVGSGWGDQQNLSMSNVSLQSDTRLNGWKTSHPLACRGGNTSNYHENDENLWNTSENHVNLNSGLQPLKPYNGSPKFQAEDSLVGNLNSNNLILNQDMRQQASNAQQSVLGRHFALNMCVNSEIDQDVEKKQNQPSKRQKIWESSASTTVERLGDNHENERDHGTVNLGDGYVGNLTTEKSLLTGKDQYSPVSGSQRFSIQSCQHTVDSKMLQNSLGSLRTVGPSFPPNHKFVGKTQFAGHKASSDPTIVSKMIAVGTKELQSRNTMPVCASNSSFDGSTAQYSQNETISQTSNNMLELLHKVDRSRNDNSVNASDLPAQAAAETSVTHTHFDWSSNLRGFGLRLAPPSQRQPPLKYAPLSQKSIDDANNWQLDKEAGCQNQPLSNSTSSVRPVPSLDEACKRENCDKMSSLYVHKHEEHPEANEHFIFSSAVASDIPLAGNQLQEQQQLLQQQHISSTQDHQVQQQQQQHISDSTLHDVQDQSVKFSFSNQANARQRVQNSSLVRQPCDSHIMAVPGQSVQTSLPALAGRFPTPGDASFAETPVPVGSQFSSGGTDYTNSTFASFSQTTSSGQQLPVVGTKSFSQSSISGMSQQVAFQKMLHNMWRNISPQQQQAGINRQILAANILQSIVNNDRITSLWGMPKEGDQVNKEGSATPEVGTSSANSQKEEDPLWGKSLNLMHTEKVDDVCKSISASQGEEAAVTKPPLDGGSTVQTSTLVHNHQHDTPCSPVLHSPLTSIASSSSDIGISGCMSKPSDVQQQNYSLLHQLQSTKASDSDVNNLTGKGPKGVGFNASQMNFNIDQRFDHRQNNIFRIPADGKVGPASHISFPPDSKPPSFALNDSDESNPSTSTAGQHDLQAHMHTTSTTSTANIMGGSDCTNIGPQMVPSWLDCYGTYQNGRSVAVCDAQRSQIAAIQQYFLQKSPATRDDNYLEQRLDSSHIGSYRQGTLATKSTPSEASPSLLPPDIMDHDIIVRSKKRKIATDVPWNKMVTEPQRLPSFSMTELDWAQAANRFIGKVDDEAETMEDGPFVPQSHRRLILTTQLMHQLIPAVPAVTLKEAVASYRSVTFTIAKSALADACSLVTSPESDSHVLLGNKNMTLGELKTSTKVENDIFSKLMEDFIGRSKKVGTDFSRLDGKTSLLDVRLECQELERFSIMNRLVKFHGRNHADAVGVSYISGAYRRNIFPQSYITALPVSGNLPEGVLCLSL
ncbi:hypothetical protein C4D60_Mb02t07990 [Musa balbisiana]|uniref:Uncharacterized protein n=1 Tax=Musa balbisiana TaxID=52838 RepID=A0A4V6T3Y6_MUSBA|nr:hypothetical protein C4D60_Mb02t07990 [Musa balbisiana]